MAKITYIDGPAGSGKTTHLDSLEEAAKARNLRVTRLVRERCTPTAAAAAVRNADVVLVDEATMAPYGGFDVNYSAGAQVFIARTGQKNTWPGLA